MWQRVLEFLPSALAIWLIQFVVGVYLQIGRVRWCGTKAKRRPLGLFSMQEVMQEVMESPQFEKAFILLGLPTIVIRIPCLEELLFRTPIILLHQGPSLGAWISITISALLFSFAHLNVRKQMHVSTPTVGVNTILSFFGGIGMGYLGIKYQSLWASVALHATWNLFWVILCELGYRLQRFLPRWLLRLIRDASR